MNAREGSYLLMDNGRCPDRLSTEAVKSLRQESAARWGQPTRRTSWATSAFKGVTEAGAACHKAHRKP